MPYPVIGGKDMETAARSAMQLRLPEPRQGVGRGRGRMTSHLAVYAVAPGALAAPIGTVTWFAGAPLATLRGPVSWRHT